VEADITHYVMLSLLYLGTVTQILGVDLLGFFFFINVYIFTTRFIWFGKSTQNVMEKQEELYRRKILRNILSFFVIII